MRPRGLSIRLAMLMVLATLVMQVGHGLYRFSVDVPQAREKGLENIDKLVASLNPALSEALYQYNEKLSEEMLKTFRSYDAIQGVWLLDSDDTDISSWVRLEGSLAQDLREKAWPLTYKGAFIGKLMVQIDISVIEKVAMNRIWRVIGFSALIGVLALVLLYIIAQSMVTKPIESLANLVSSIDSQAFSKDDIQQLDAVQVYYEVSALRDSIKSILYELNEHIGEKEQAMILLKEFNVALEEKVKERTEELELAKEKAEVANRAKTDFLNVVTHELRTPLNGVLGFASILKGRKFDDKDMKLIDGIEQSGKGLLILLNDIIDFIDLDSKPLSLQTFSVYDALISAFNEFKNKATEKQLTLNFQVGQDLILHGDPKRLTIMARQLFSNAVKFTQEGEVSLTCEKHGRGVRLCISDTGIGMTQEHIDGLSQALFFQQDQGLNRQSEGLGLGLALVHRICKKWGGRMTITCNEPKGTQVCLELDNIADSAQL